MSEKPQHRADPKRPRHAAQAPDDPASTDLDILFPGTRSHRAAPKPKPKPGKTAAAAVAATGTIALVWTMSQGKVEPVQQAEAISAERTYTTDPQPEVTTGPVQIVQESPKIVTEEAPPPAPVAPPVVTPEPVATAAPVVAEQAPAPAPVAAPAPAAPAPAPAGDAGADTRAAIVAAAYAQIGESQDCVKMVADALATVGIYWYKWPVEYYQIGRPVPAAEALPGDLIYYQNGMGASVAGLAHIAIYVGNGMAVHGGWNGWTTVLSSVNVGSGPNYIRLNL